jgi:chloramphenicol-sensitive protein RarD
VVITPVPSTENSKGVWLGVTAYGLWGVFPLFFLLLAAAGAPEVIAHRILWTFVLVTALLPIVGQWHRLRLTLADRRLVLTLAAGGVLVATNWSIYVWAVMNDYVLDASLGYFVNPLVTVGLAVVVLHERLRPGQVAALAVGTSAVVVISVGYGQVPWISLLLALSFGGYSLIKKRVGPEVAPLVGLSLETAPLAPFALGFMLWLQWTGAATLTTNGPTHLVALLSTGIVTATPLVIFAAAAQRVPLATLGLLQYICPIMQFTLGVLVFGEQMPPARWIGFALIWVALIVLTADGVRASRNSLAR